MTKANLAQGKDRYIWDTGRMPVQKGISPQLYFLVKMSIGKFKYVIPADKNSHTIKRRPDGFFVGCPVDHG